MLNRQEILDLLREKAFDKTEYWVTSGAAMVLYGLKDRTRDIDLGCTSPMADCLERKGYPVEILQDGSRKIAYSNTIELFENWLEGDVVFLEGLPVVSLAGLLKMKEALGREKDLEDIRLIKEQLSKC